MKLFRQIPLLLAGLVLPLSALAMDASHYTAVRQANPPMALTVVNGSADLQSLSSGKVFETLGVVVDASGPSSFTLNGNSGQLLTFTTPKPDTDIVAGAPLNVLARLTDDGKYETLAVTSADAAPVADTSKPTAKPAAKPAAKSATKSATKPAPSTASFASQLKSYAAKIRQFNKSITIAASEQIANAVLTKSPRYGLDPRLVFALLAQESRFNPRAVSPVGAQGLGQLMPGTAKALGVKNSFDIEQNVDGTVRYLSTQLKRFNGNVAYALAAYNAGPGSVLRYGGIPPFRETQNYVKTISAHFNQLTAQLL